MRLDVDATRLERLGNAHQGSGGAEAVTERGHAPLRLLPDLAGEVVAMVRDRIRIVELVGRVVAGLGRQLSCALDHVADVLRGDARPALH